MCELRNTPHIGRLSINLVLLIEPDLHYLYKGSLARLTSPARLHRRLRRVASKGLGQRAHGAMSRPTSAGYYGAREKRVTARNTFTKDGCFLPTQLTQEPTGPAITVSHASPPTHRQAVDKLCVIDRASPTLLSPHHVMPGMTCGETAAKTSSLSTNDTQLVHSVSSLLPSHHVIPPRVPTLRREEATLLSQAEQAGHASANHTHTQPFRAEPPMGCGEDSYPCSGGRGSSVARFHDSRIKTRGCTAAFRALLRMAERVYPGQIDGQANQQ